jgi:hypothetical protein
MSNLVRFKYLINNLNLLKKKDKEVLYSARENLYIQKQDKYTMEKLI